MLQIAKELYIKLQKQTMRVKMHSCFHSALNVQNGNEMITFLAAGKCLQPMSIRFGQPVDFQERRIPKGLLYLSMNGLSDGTTSVFTFSDFEVRETQADLRITFGAECAEWIRSFLRKQEDKGIHGLIEGKVDDVLIGFLEPRIQKFRAAVKTRDCEEILSAVNRAAGCGPGLTPSSDDFLCGYISVMPQTEEYAEIRKIIADAAAAKTNDISASLLKNAEKGHFSEDILELFCGFETEDRMRIEHALQKTADFGSSSGCDFLTGMYYGILDAQQKGR